MPKFLLAELSYMAKITLFEFNPRGRIQIGPSGNGDEGLFSAELGQPTEPEEETTLEEDESGGGVAKVILPLLVLAVLAVAIRVITGGDEEVEEIDAEEEEAPGRLDRFTSTTE